MRDARKRRSRVGSACGWLTQWRYAALFRLEELWLRPDELLPREDDEPRPVVVAFDLVLPRPEDDELLRPEEMLRVLEFELRLELPELALRAEPAELREEVLLLCPLACSSSG